MKNSHEGLFFPTQDLVKWIVYTETCAELDFVVVM